jgi:TonB-dependent SusC/RagA subfamily outer membrane receptor
MNSNKKNQPWNIRSSRLLLFSLFLFSSILSYAQVNVRGKVMDTAGEALIGVNVIVKGTNQGTVTDINGVFTLRAPSSNSTLLFSYVGFREQEVALNGRTELQVTMEQDTEFLDEVIVVGYGTQKRASITGAVSTLSDTELIKAPVVGVTNVLGARVAGVTMLQQSGQPGNDAASLLVRGEGATYIVDGVIRSINEIDPNEIESISILKDATSASVYGLNATSVVIVTTKRGKDGKLGISYNGTYGISKNANQLEWLDGPSYAYWYNKAREMDGDEAVFTSAQVEK